MISLNLTHILQYKLNRSEKKILTLASIGSFIEFYDFTIFGFYTIYFAPEIFPDNHIVNAMMYAYSAYTASFLLKPAGIYLSQRFLHRMKSERILLITIIAMGICSFVMGIIPPYIIGGLLSSWTMIAFRLIQGIAAGCEIQGMIRFIDETMPEEKNHYAISALLLGTELGGLSAIAINLVLNHLMSNSDIEAWGWRIPFLLGGAFSMLAFLIRARFRRISHLKQINSEIASNIFILVKQYWRQCFVLASVVGIASTLWVNCINYMPLVLHLELNLSYLKTGSVIFRASIYAIVISYLIGLAAKKVTPYTLLMLTLVLTFGGIPLSYYLLDMRLHIDTAVAILISLHGAMACLAPLVFFGAIFPQKIRLSGTYISINLSYTLFGVLSPLIVICLLYLTHKYFIIQTIYTMLVTVISIIGLSLFHKIKEPG